MYLPPTNTTLTAVVALAKATAISKLHRPTPTPTGVDADPAGQSSNQNTLSILFGVLAAVLSLTAILIGYLQLRQFKRCKTDDQREVTAKPVCEIVEVWTISRKQTWRMAMTPETKAGVSMSEKVVEAA